MRQGHASKHATDAAAAAHAAEAADASSSKPRSSAAPPAAAASAPYSPPSTVFRGARWYSLCVPPVELRLDITLRNGQCFGWSRIDPLAIEEATAKAASKGKRKREAAVKNEAAPTDSTSAADVSPAMSQSPTDGDEDASDSRMLPIAKQESAASVASTSDDGRVKMELDQCDAASSFSSFSAAACAAAAASPSGCAPLSDSDPHYIGVLGSSLIGIRQTATDIWYRAHWHQPIPAAGIADSAAASSSTNSSSAASAAATAAPTPSELDAQLRDYFHLPATSLDVRGVRQHGDMQLASLYPQWSQSATVRFQFVARCFPGVRMLRQDPWETLISFICSSNNHISRIGGMLAALRAKYGVEIVLGPEAREALGAGVHGRRFFVFPTVDALCAATEAELRALGFGYRAKYISSTAQLLRQRGGASYLAGLRLQPRAAVEKSLEDFAGVGPKVSSCIALFACDSLDAIPVDTHVWQIALRDYPAAAAKEGLDLSAVKSLTPRVYKQVGDLFRRSFGALAGWAHCILFLAELPEFKRRLAEAGLSEAEMQMAAEPQTAKNEFAAASSSSAVNPTAAVGAPKNAAGLAQEMDGDETEDDEPRPPAAAATAKQNHSSAKSKKPRNHAEKPADSATATLAAADRACIPSAEARARMKGDELQLPAAASGPQLIPVPTQTRQCRSIA